MQVVTMFSVFRCSTDSSSQRWTTRHVLEFSSLPDSSTPVTMHDFPMLLKPVTMLVTTSQLLLNPSRCPSPVFHTYPTVTQSVTMLEFSNFYSICYDARVFQLLLHPSRCFVHSNRLVFTACVNSSRSSEPFSDS